MVRIHTNWEPKAPKRGPGAPSLAPTALDLPLEAPKAPPPPLRNGRGQIKPAKGKSAPIGHPDPVMAARLAAIRVKFRTPTDSRGLREAIMSSLPPLHKKQREIADHPAKYKVVNTGRRFGKTTGAAWVAIDKATQGRRVLLASTTQEQADAFWEYCKRWLAPFIEAGEVIKNETRRILEFGAFGGRIRVKTASDADALRGDYSDFLVLDECALLAPDAWEKVGAPMLLDNDGEAWFLSTPRRRNWYFHLFKRAEADLTGRWKTFSATSYDNPFLSQDALAEIIHNMTDEAYQQEILAVFLEGEGAVFRNIHSCMGDPRHGGRCAPETNPYAHEGHLKVGGGDWGHVEDNTVLSIMCITCRAEIFFDRFTGIKFALQRERIKNSHYIWKPMLWRLESNSIGMPNLEVLHDEDKLPVEGFDTNKKTKPQLVNQLALALERETFHYLNRPAATAEFEAYESKKSPTTGHISYSAPPGMKDDSVIARGIATDAALNTGLDTGPIATTFVQIAQVVSMEGGEGLLNSEAVGDVGGGGVSAIETAPAYAGYNQAMPTPPGRPW